MTNSNVFSYSIYLRYNPWANNSSGNQASPVTVEVGEGKHQISMGLLQSILQYTKNGGGEASFQELVNMARYDGLSSEEKQLLDTLKHNSSSVVNAQLFVSETKSEDITILKGIPTEEYLKDLKYAEESDFKARDFEKYRKKMQKISGNQPINEMFMDVSGTNVKLSNVHITDFSRLNDLKIHSSAF